MCQRLLVAAERVPVRMALVSSTGMGSGVMTTLDLVKTAVQSASQSLPTEMRLVSVMEGNRWASVALGGNLGMGKLAVWVDDIVELSARLTLIGVRVVCLL